MIINVFVCVCGSWAGLQQRSPWDVGDARCSARPLHRCHADSDPGTKWRVGRVCWSFCCYCMCALCKHAHSIVNSSLCAPQLPVWQPPRALSPGPGPGVAGCCAAALLALQIIPDWPLLQEASHWEQRQQGDPGAGDGSFCLFHADSMLSVFNLFF